MTSTLNENHSGATVVIAYGESFRPQLWHSSLKKCGYRCVTVSDVSSLRDCLHDFPDLLLLDWTLSENVSRSLWEALELDCQTAEVPCLVFPDTLYSYPDWVAGCLRRLDDLDELLGKVASQLKIARLSRDLNLAHEKLIAKQFQLDESLKSAAHIQKSLVPANAPRVSRFSFSWQFLPCERVGGDLFNIHWLDETTLVVYVLDVSGHGISSAMMTVSISQALSSQGGQLLKHHSDQPPFYEIVPPDQVLAELDQEYPFERFEMFFSICYMLIDVRTGHVRYSNAAHPPPVLVRADGTMQMLDAGGTIIGLGGLVPFEEGQTELFPGDRLFLYTDGIAEASNSAGDFLGDDRFRKMLNDGGEVPLATVCEDVVGAVYEFCGEMKVQDDITLLGIEFCSP